MIVRIERIVRPFQTRDVRPGRQVTAQYAPRPENVELVMGQNGTGRIMDGSVSQDMTKYMDVKQKEKRTQEEPEPEPEE